MSVKRFGAQNFKKNRVDKWSMRSSFFFTSHSWTFVLTSLWIENFARKQKSKTCICEHWSNTKRFRFNAVIFFSKRYTFRDELRAYFYAFVCLSCFSPWERTTCKKSVDNFSRTNFLWFSFNNRSTFTAVCFEHALNYFNIFK